MKTQILARLQRLDINPIKPQRINVVKSDASLAELTSILFQDLAVLKIKYLNYDGNIIVPAGYLGIAGALQTLPRIFVNYKKTVANYSNPYERYGKIMLEMLYSNSNSTKTILGEVCFEQYRDTNDKLTTFTDVIEFIEIKVIAKEQSDII